MLDHLEKREFVKTLMMEKENESREFEMPVESSPTQKSGYKTAEILPKK